MRALSQFPTTRPIRQLSLSFGTQPLRGLSPIDRARAVALLAFLLAQAAGVVTEERDDVER